MMTEAEKRADILQILRDIEGSDCDCPHYLDCGCEEPCECEKMVSPPCEHILSKTCGLTFEEIEELVRSAFAQPRPATSRATVPWFNLSQEARVQIMSERYGPVERGEGPGLFALWHRGDKGEDDHQRRLAGRGRNGRAFDRGLLPGNDRASILEFKDTACKT